MSIAERYRECARVIDMCEGTEVHPWKCIKYMSNDWRMENRLDLDRQGDYDFAVAILEGKPVFVGDKVYWKHDGSEFEWGIVNHRLFSWGNDLTRTPPKRTFTLAGRELPLPSKTITQWHAYAGRLPYYFNDPADRYAFEDALNAIIHEAMQK